MHTKKGPYYWQEERLDLLRKVLLIARSWNEARKLMMEYGIQSNKTTLSTIANNHKMPRPFINPTKTKGRKPREKE